MGKLYNQLVTYFKNTPKMKQMELYKDYHLIDLSLPSGTLWMDRNIGASSPEDSVLYFAWGETQGYTTDEVGKAKQFSWSDYKFGKEKALTKYNSTDGLIILETTDDAANQYIGGKCNIPTKEQLQELLDNTISTWTMQNGVYGRLFTSKDNGNSIFVPAAGFGGDGSMGGVGSGGGLCSSSLDGDNTNGAWGLGFVSGGACLYSNDRCYGGSVRGVVDGKNYLKRREKLLQEPLFKPLTHTVIDNEEN